jgi:hypothetical protein
MSAPSGNVEPSTFSTRSPLRLASGAVKLICMQISVFPFMLLGFGFLAWLSVVRYYVLIMTARCSLCVLASMA